jgi:hypothetical protein
VVSSGTVNENRYLGLTSSIVIDPTFAVGRAFRIRGTPAAVLVDADGKIASKVANGAAAVLALANSEHGITSGLNAEIIWP